MTVERKWNGTEWVITGGGGDVAVGAVGMRATVEIDSAPSIGTSWTTVPTTRIEEDHGGAFSLAANGVMTCLIAGVYSISGGVFWARTTDADLRANLNLNGASIGKGLHSVSTNKYATLTMTATVSLNVGDQIWMSAWASPASSLMSNTTDYQGNYLEAFSVAGLKGDKGDTGDPGWKPRPVWQDVQTQHNINSTSSNASLNPPTSISWTNQESYPMMVRYEGAGLCYMSGATDLMYLLPDVSGGTSLGIGVEWRVDFPDTEGGTYFPAFHLAAMAQVAPGATVTFEITGRSTSPMDGYIRYFRHQAWAVGPA